MTANLLCMRSSDVTAASLTRAVTILLLILGVLAAFWEGEVPCVTALERERDWDPYPSPHQQAAHS